MFWRWHFRQEIDQRGEGCPFDLTENSNNGGEIYRARPFSGLGQEEVARAC